MKDETLRTRHLRTEQILPRFSLGDREETELFLDR